MTQHRNLAYGERLPESLLDALGELLGTYVSPTFKLELASPTTVEVVAGAGNAQVCLALQGRWRFNAATTTRAHPGGGAGAYDVWAVASENSFVPSVPEVDNTVYGFTLRIVASGGNPVTGSGATAIGRKVGELAWDGAAITALTTTVIAGGIAAGSIVEAMLATDAVSARVIAAGAVGTGEIQDASVTAGKIAAGVVPHVESGVGNWPDVPAFGSPTPVSVSYAAAGASGSRVGVTQASGANILDVAVSSVGASGFTAEAYSNIGGGGPYSIDFHWIAHIT